MKDFYTQCLLDLYALTGIEQVRWMQNDLTNGKRDFELCVAGMVQASKQFSYISEDDQKQIITRMMIEDRQYKTLNSRTVWGWLDGAKGTYFRGQTHFEESPDVEQTPEQIKRVDELLEEWKKNLMGGVLPTYGDLEREKKRIIAEDKERGEPKKGSGYKVDPELIAKRELHDLWIRENFNLDGKKKEGWLDEETWLELLKESTSPTKEAEQHVKENDSPLTK